MFHEKRRESCSGLNGPKEEIMNATSTATLAKGAVEWSVVLSIAMVLAGIVAIFIPAVAGITVTVLAGWLLIFSGIAHLIFGWERRTTGVLPWELLVGMLYIVIGCYLLFHISAALAALTVVLGIYLFAEAILEFLLSYRLHPLPGSGWLAIDGLVTLVLALLIWRTWSASWVIGVLIGISILFSGISRLMLSLAARRVVANVP
jgi:uncharacterized membrane protein HdeD (DUF308 family)